MSPGSPQWRLPCERRILWEWNSWLFKCCTPNWSLRYGTHYILLFRFLWVDLYFWNRRRDWCFDNDNYNIHTCIHTFSSNHNYNSQGSTDKNRLVPDKTRTEQCLKTRDLSGPGPIWFWKVRTDRPLAFRESLTATTTTTVTTTTEPKVANALFWGAKNIVKIGIGVAAGFVVLSGLAHGLWMIGTDSIHVIWLFHFTFFYNWS